MKITSKSTEEHRRLRQQFHEETGIYAIKDNESYMSWLEDKLVKNCSIQSVSVSYFREIPIAPMTDLQKQFNISTHDAAIRTLKEMNIPQDLIEKKSNSR